MDLLATLTASADSSFLDKIENVIAIAIGIVTAISLLLAKLAKVSKQLRTVIGGVEEATASMPIEVMKLFDQAKKSGVPVKPDEVGQILAKKTKGAIASVALEEGVNALLHETVKRVTDPAHSSEGGEARSPMLIVGVILTLAVIGLCLFGAGCVGGLNREYVEADMARRQSIGKAYEYHLHNCSPYLIVWSPGQFPVSVTPTPEVIEAGEADLGAWDRAIEQAKKRINEEGR